MKTLLLFAAIVILFASCGGPKTGTVNVTSSKIDTASLPKNIKYKGSIDTAVKFTDSEGDHIIVTSEDETAEKTDNGDRLNGIYLYAYCYKLNNGVWHLMWQMQDNTGTCEEDVSGGYLPKTFAITDLEKNGKAEVWLVYQLACRGGVDPSAMKIIMHEGNKKYAMRGETRVKVNATDYYGGSNEFDAAFKNGPAVFRQYAQQLWKKNVVENTNVLAQ